MPPQDITLGKAIEPEIPQPTEEMKQSPKEESTKPKEESGWFKLYLRYLFFTLFFLVMSTSLIVGAVYVTYHLKNSKLIIKKENAEVLSASAEEQLDQDDPCTGNYTNPEFPTFALEYNKCLWLISDSYDSFDKLTVKLTSSGYEMKFDLYKNRYSTYEYIVCGNYGTEIIKHSKTITRIYNKDIPEYLYVPKVTTRLDYGFDSLLQRAHEKEEVSTYCYDKNLVFYSKGGFAVVPRLFKITREDFDSRMIEQADAIVQKMVY